MRTRTYLAVASCGPLTNFPVALDHKQGGSNRSHRAIPSQQLRSRWRDASRATAPAAMHEEVS